MEENESCSFYCKTRNDSYVVWYGTNLVNRMHMIREQADGQRLQSLSVLDAL